MTQKEAAQLIEMAKAEADKIRVNATPEQIERLNKRQANPNDREGCIYGQMTGDCYSDAAERLIISCCEKVFHSADIGVGKDVTPNGTPYRVGGYDRKYAYCSPIEVLINRHSAYDPQMSHVFVPNPVDKKNMGVVIDYIKGEIPDLLSINLSKIIEK